MESWPRQAWVTRAKHRDFHVVGDRFTGVSIGLGGDVSARLYDKTFQIESESHQYYLHDLWRDAGWFPADPVWRLEFQLRRAAIARYDLRSLADVQGVCDGLWRYLTCRWLRLTEPNEHDDTRARWPTHPLWTALNEVQWEGNDRLVAKPVNSGAPSNKYLARHATSALTSIMAREGTTDIAKGWQDLKNTVEDYWQAKELWEGAPAHELIQDNVRAKGRKFGTMNNVDRICERDAGVDDEEQRQAAERYRKASRG